ncbi:unnamed protein product [Eruca vesicaria subsp. sativa]|uniref:Uncharacterized protein n=1 Tax=Eruca vesicaria subsp. sativa TaxID=29727 RepID=A0ABC8JWP8_ERUVS|nr:unnamed protein product [Eruca vesicaria subsp. sativa]
MKSRLLATKNSMQRDVPLGTSKFPRFVFRFERGCVCVFERLKSMAVSNAVHVSSKLQRWYRIQMISLLRLPISALRDSASNADSISDPLQNFKEKHHSPEDYSLLAAIPLFLFPALGAWLFGYEIGATSCAIISIKYPTLSGISWTVFALCRQITELIVVVDPGFRNLPSSHVTRHSGSYEIARVL